MKNASRNSLKFIQAFFTVGILLFAAQEAALAQVSSSPQLWKKRELTASAKAAPEVTKRMGVTIDLRLLRSKSNRSLSLPMPDGRTLRAIKSGQSAIPHGLIWRGKIVDQPSSSVNFSVVNETVVGSILTGRGQSFRLRRDPSGVQVIEEVDLRKLPPEGNPTRVPGLRGRKGGDPAGDTCATDGIDQIDLMVVYTQDARAGAGGKDAMEADIYLGVDLANQSYINSDIDQRLRLVHVAEVSYAESGDTILDRDRLKAKADGFVDNVHTLRDTFGADVVAMITETGDWCGFSYIMDPVGNAFEDSAFSVVVRSCATTAGKYSFPHEIGHNMSARHDWVADNTNNSPYAYNHGHFETAPSSGSPWRTIMSYTNGCTSAGVTCPRALNWSNPNINIGTDPTGVATGAQQQDNHRTLNNTALTVANFRCSSPNRDDVWMKDTWSDTGAEPDPNQAGLPMWQSPYIWVQNAQDTQITHQHEHQNPIKDQQNFIYVKLHNGGAATTANLEVSIANASVGLTWPGDWSLINSVPVSIAAHATKIVEVPWTPTATGHHCLIARWVSPTDPMTTPEGPNIGANVRGNNNIVWHNVNIIDLGGDSVADAKFLVQNAVRKGRISLAVLPERPMRKDVRPRPTFLDFGKVALKFDDKLMAAWKRADYSGTGFKRNGNVVTITDKKGAVINLGALSPKFKASATILFERPKQGSFPHDEFVVLVTERDADKKAVGGISYRIRTFKQ